MSPNSCPYLGKNVPVIVVVYLPEYILQLVLRQLVPEGGHDVLEVIHHQDVALHHLPLDLLLN